MAVNAEAFGFPFFAQLRHRFCILNIHPRLEAIPGKRTLHGTGVDIGESEPAGDSFGVSALAAGAGAVNGDDDGV